MPYFSASNPNPAAGRAWKKPEQPISMVGTLDPNQTALADQLKKMLTNWQSGGSSSLAGLTKFISNVPSGLPSSITSALERAMTGKVSEEYWKNTVAAPAMKTFTEDIAPAIREEFVGPGTFWGGAKAEGVAKGASNLADSLAAARGQMANEALNRASTSALGYGGLLTQNLGNWMNAFMAANPTYTEYIPGAIKKAMGTTTKLTTRPAQPAQPTESATPYTGNVPGKMYSGGRYW
jgi:hypothetical protein